MKAVISILLSFLMLSVIHAEPASSPVSPIVVHVPKDGVIQFCGTTVSFNELRERIVQVAKRDKETPVRITAAPSVDHKGVLPIIELCRSAGLRRVSIETVLPGEGPRSSGH
jgi:biopolymer transport protein ExbD